jgi:hypothetical protein
VVCNIRVTALQPAPPTPTTTILHGVRASDDDDDDDDDDDGRFNADADQKPPEARLCWRLGRNSGIQVDSGWRVLVTVLVVVLDGITKPSPTEANNINNSIATRIIAGARSSDFSKMEGKKRTVGGGDLVKSVKRKARLDARPCARLRPPGLTPGGTSSKRGRASQNNARTQSHLRNDLYLNEREHAHPRLIVMTPSAAKPLRQGWHQIIRSFNSQFAVDKDFAD